MSKTKTETPVLRNSADIPWEENRLYLPADETEKRTKLFTNASRKRSQTATRWMNITMKCSAA